MLCEMCASIGRMRVTDTGYPKGRPPCEDPSLDCDACGKTLGASVGGRVAETIAQLARFGLVGHRRLFHRRA